MVTVRNKFDTLQKTSEGYILNSKYENFVNAQIEAAANCIPTKPTAKFRVPWDNMKKNLYLIKETQQMPMPRNVKPRKNLPTHTKNNN